MAMFDLRLILPVIGVLLTSYVIWFVSCFYMNLAYRGGRTTEFIMKASYKPYSIIKLLLVFICLVTFYIPFIFEPETKDLDILALSIFCYLIYCAICLIDSLKAISAYVASTNTST